MLGITITDHKHGHDPVSQSYLYIFSLSCVLSANVIELYLDPPYCFRCLRLDAGILGEKFLCLSNILHFLVILQIDENSFLSDKTPLSISLFYSIT